MSDRLEIFKYDDDTRPENEIWTEMTPLCWGCEGPLDQYWQRILQITSNNTDNGVDPVLCRSCFLVIYNLANRGW